MEREGISVCEGEVIYTTLQSDGARKEECVARINSSECSEFGQVYSLVHSVLSTSHYQLS